MKPLFLLKVLAQEFKNPYFLLKSLIFSSLFILLALALLNYRSYLSFITADYPLVSRLNILFLITIGSFSAVTILDIVLLVVTAVLFGINLQLVVEKIKVLRKSGSLNVTVGAGIVSLAATGCASCGLSLASLVGLTGVVALLPFGGIELYVLSIGVLLVLLFYNLHTYVKVCKIRS